MSDENVSYPPSLSFPFPLSRREWKFFFFFVQVVFLENSQEYLSVYTLVKTCFEILSSISGLIRLLYQVSLAHLLFWITFFNSHPLPPSHFSVSNLGLISNCDFPYLSLSHHVLKPLRPFSSVKVIRHVGSHHFFPPLTPLPSPSFLQHS